ncbi:hypothetical protein JZ751_009708, partial [Albula glossodonta]
MSGKRITVTRGRRSSLTIIGGLLILVGALGVQRSSFVVAVRIIPLVRVLSLSWVTHDRYYWTHHIWEKRANRSRREQRRVEALHPPTEAVGELTDQSSPGWA